MNSAARSFEARAFSTKEDKWVSAEQAPEPYELAILLCRDGVQRRGSWNGKVWWGYDERVRRPRPLEPIAWRPIS